MTEKDQVKSTISEKLLEELFNMFFDSIFGYKKNYENNFNPKIKKEFYNNIKANFSDFTEENIEKAAKKAEKTKEDIKKAMLAFSAMFDEGGIEGYENELAKEEQSRRLREVFFSENGASKYYNDHENDGNDEIIKIINEKINEKKEKINNLLKNFEDLKEKELNSILTKKQDFEETIDYLDKLIENNKNNEKAKSLKEELIKYEDKDLDSLFFEDAVKDFVKYNEENREIKDGNIIAKEGKKDVKIPSLENNKYFKIDEIKESLEKNDPKLKKFIDTRNLISSGNNEIINKFLKEYDKIQNSKYAKKIKEYQKNYSEKKKRAEEIDRLNEENKNRIKTIETNEKIINKATESIDKIEEKIRESEKIINGKKDEFKELSLYEKIFGKKAKEIKQAIKLNKFKIKCYQKDIKEAEKGIKEAKKINEDYKKDICKSVKGINKHYHKDKVELKYKDLKGKTSSEINKIYKKGVEDIVSEYTKSVLNNTRETKRFKELQKAQEKLQEEHRKNISSSKKIDKIIIKDEVNINVKKNKLNTYIDSLKNIKKEYNSKNNIIFSNNNKKNENTLNQQ